MSPRELKSPIFNVLPPNVPLVSVGIKSFVFEHLCVCVSVCDVWCIDYLHLTSMNISLRGKKTESLCSLPASKAGDVQFVLDSKSGAPRKLKI